MGRRPVAQSLKWSLHVHCAGPFARPNSLTRPRARVSEQGKVRQVVHTADGGLAAQTMDLTFLPRFLAAALKFEFSIKTFVGPNAVSGHMRGRIFMGRGEMDRLFNDSPAASENDETLLRTTDPHRSSPPLLNALFIRSLP